MSSKQKAIIYPYNEEFASVVRHRDLINEYVIVGLVSPKGLMLDGKDASEVDKRPNMKITVSSDFVGCLDKCDTVIISDYKLEYDNGYKEVLYDNINKAIDMKKNIICTFQLDNNIYNAFLARAQINNVDFKYYSKQSKWLPNIQLNKELSSFDVPIVFICGIGEMTNKFDVQLALRHQMLANDYKISQIGTRHYCELFGFHSFPCWMMDNSLTDNDKILMFNKYIKHIEKCEEPELIIIGIPGGVLPFNNYLNNGFGLLNYEISNAVKPDFCIFNLHCNDLANKYLEMVNRTLEYKFGYKPDCFVVSNYAIDWSKSKQIKDYSYNTYSHKVVDLKIDSNTYKIPLFNILKDNDNTQLYDYFIRTLHGYSNTEQINDGLDII